MKKCTRLCLAYQHSWAPAGGITSVNALQARCAAQAHFVDTTAVSRQYLHSTSPTIPYKSKTSKKTNPNELLSELSETIRTHGPLPISRYMTLCLSHPRLGYYASKEVFGATGDFITSPEISQVFGELIAIWYTIAWSAQGSCSDVRIIELGPGKGTLLIDMLRTFKSLKTGPSISSVHLIESSAALREVQRKELVKAGYPIESVYWWDSVDQVPSTHEEFSMVLAHEFFDALPIHIFENTVKGWREVLVDIQDPKAIIVTSSSSSKDGLRLVLAPNPTPASAIYTHLSATENAHLLDVDTSTKGVTSSPAIIGNSVAKRMQRLPVGSRMEISPASWNVAQEMAKTIAGVKGGAGLVIDYGDSKGFGRSWRGFRKHQIVDPLSEPGHTDLTANVDFQALKSAIGEHAVTHSPLSQGTFLNALGLAVRLEALVRQAPEERRSEIESAGRRLVDSATMGKEYKVMAFTPRSADTAGEEGKFYPFGVVKEDAMTK